MELSCPLGTTRCIPHENFLRKPYNNSFIDQASSVKIAGFWPRSFFFESLWTETESRSINTQKKSEANIQPSWPYIRSITIFYVLSPAFLNGFFFTISSLDQVKTVKLFLSPLSGFSFQIKHAASELSAEKHSGCGNRGKTCSH